MYFARLYRLVQPVLFLVCVSCVCFFGTYDGHASALEAPIDMVEETYNTICFLEGDNLLIGSGNKLTESNIKMRSFSIRANGITVTAGEKINDFNTNSYPEVSCNIKYISSDISNGDGRDMNGQFRMRYVYCLEHFKNAPINQSFTMSDYETPAVYHVIYHGAMYYGETSRDTNHSTGNWKFDYLATQMAVSIVRNEFTLKEITDSIMKSPASNDDKNRVIQAITNMVNDALSVEGQSASGFDQNGWFRMDSEGRYTLELEKYSDEWTKGDDGFFYTDWIVPVLYSKEGYYSNSEILSLEHQPIQDVIIEKKYDDCVHSPYRLKVKESIYVQWTRIGKTIVSEISVKSPVRWKTAVFVPDNNKDFQKITFPVYENVNNYTTFQANTSFVIPKEVMQYDLVIKKNNNMGETLDNVEFSIYGDELLNELCDKQMTDKGKLSFTNLESNKLYYLVETKAAPGYPEKQLNQIIYTISAFPDEEGNMIYYVGDSKCVEDTEGNNFYYKIVDQIPTIFISITNPIGEPLPETGSYQTIWNVLIGCFVMISTITRKVRY